MKRESITGITTVLLLIATIICVITGFVKWPGLISMSGMSYRQGPLVLVTDLHI